MKKFKKEWKPIYLFGKETQYRVSNYGDILDTNNEKLRTHYISKKTRYHMVRLKIDDEWMNFSVSRLVATAFLANPFNYEEVDHLNCDRDNNSIWNLEWVTHEENMKRAIDKGRCYKNDNTYYKFPTRDQISHVCKIMSILYIPVPEISKITGVAENTINKIRLRKRWKSVSKNYDFDRYNEYVLERTRNKFCGENNHNSTISDNVVHEICKELVKNEKSIREISEIFNVKKGFVHDIKLRRTRTNVSSQYDFSKYDMTEFGYHKKDLDKINILLESGTSPKDIIEILSLPNNKKTISMIYGRKYHIVQK